MSEVTYCEVCLTNFTDDNDFNHRFDYPVCLSCADKVNCIICKNPKDTFSTEWEYQQCQQCSIKELV